MVLLGSSTMQDVQLETDPQNVWLLEGCDELRELRASMLRRSHPQAVVEVFRSASALLRRLHAVREPPSVVIVDAWEVRGAESEIIGPCRGARRVVALVSTNEEAERWLELGARLVLIKGLSDGEVLGAAVEDRLEDRAGARRPSSAGRTERPAGRGRVSPPVG